jgi:hypothetical protein
LEKHTTTRFRQRNRCAGAVLRRPRSGSRLRDPPLSKTYATLVNCQIAAAPLRQRQRLRFS